MSSNIRIQRICQYCNSEFTAKTTVTKYCSDTCAKRAYKARKRAEKIESSKKETIATVQKPIHELKAKEFLTVREMSQLLNCSVRTGYRLIKDHKIKAVNLGQRKTIIKRSEIDKLFE